MGTCVHRRADTSPMTITQPTPSTPTCSTARHAVQSRLDTLPDWVLSDAATLDDALPRLWAGWRLVHAVAFFGEDTAALYARGADWALLAFDGGSGADWEGASVAERRAVLSRLTGTVLSAGSLTTLMGLVADLPGPADEAVASYPVEAMAAVLAEWAEQTCTGGRHVLVNGNRAAALLLAHVARMQAEFATDVAEGEVPDPNLSFIPGGCDLHSYPTFERDA